MQVSIDKSNGFKLIDAVNEIVHEIKFSEIDTFEDVYEDGKDISSYCIVTTKDGIVYTATDIEMCWIEGELE
jgi:hypothetical protein